MSAKFPVITSKVNELWRFLCSPEHWNLRRKTEINYPATIHTKIYNHEPWLSERIHQNRWGLTHEHSLYRILLDLCPLGEFNGQPGWIFVSPGFWKEILGGFEILGIYTTNRTLFINSCPRTAWKKLINDVLFEMYWTNLQLIFLASKKRERFIES